MPNRRRISSAARATLSPTLVGIAEQRELLAGLRVPRPPTPSRRTRMPRQCGRASSSAARKITSVSSVGTGRVRWREVVTKALSRTFTAIVRARTLAGAEPPGDAVREGQQCPLEQLGARRVDIERVLVADRLGRFAVRHRGGVDASGAGRQDRTLAPEAPRQQVVRQRREVADRAHAVVGQRTRRPLAHAPQPRDRQRREEVGLPPRLDDDEAVGLAQVRGHLGHELGRGDADRRRQLQLGADGRLDGTSDLDRAAMQELGARHVEEGLVDRDRLDGRREAPQDAP